MDEFLPSNFQPFNLIPLEQRPTHHKEHSNG